MPGGLSKVMNCVRNASARYRFLSQTLFCFVLGLILFSWSAYAPPAIASSSKSTRKEKKAESRKPPKKAATQNKGVVKAKAVYCVNLSHNKTVLARNADKQLPVASLTKLMTALVALERLPLNRKVRVPSYIRKVPKSVVGLKPGDRISVRDLLHGLLIASGNDCAETLASAFPGGRHRFISAMNRKARALGARRTRFYTPSGLDQRLVRKKKNGKRRVRVRSNVSTAREIAMIARKAFANKTIKAISGKKGYVIRSAKLKRGYPVRSTNKLLRGRLPIEAGKTGYTHRAGHCLASRFHPGRNIFLIVVLGSPDHFRDTRLVYKRALKKTKKAKKQPPSRRTHRRLHAEKRVAG